MTYLQFITIAVFPISVAALMLVGGAMHRHAFDPYFSMNLPLCLLLSISGWAGVGYCLWVWGLLA